MLKVKKLRTALVVSPFIICLYLSGIAVGADPCFQGFSTIPGSVQYDESWLLECDPNNPEEIDPGESITISVKGGRPIYSWSVIGNGFSLEHDQTKGLSNTLHADIDACGTATITVADVSGAAVTCIVRCSNGWWQQKCYCVWNCEEHPECYSLCGIGVHTGGVVYELVSGDRKTIQHTGWQGGCGGSLDPPLQCPPADTRCGNCPPNNTSAPNCVDPRWQPLDPYMCIVSPDGSYTSVSCYEARVLEYFEWVCP